MERGRGALVIGLIVLCAPAVAAFSATEKVGGVRHSAAFAAPPSTGGGRILAGRRGININPIACRAAFRAVLGGGRRATATRASAGQGLLGLRGGAMSTDSKLGATLDTLKFDNTFIRDLPADPISQQDKVKGNTPRQVQKACFSLVLPEKVPGPKLVSYSKECAALIDLPSSECEKQRFADILGGNDLFPGSVPMAMCYGGHQFGNWAGQLGDGRAMSLGEVVNAAGERWELQLKGAGPTPYSRTADGKAVLRSSVREYLCSEAMFHLGVPTTRALSLVLTGEQVVRDMLYDGNPKPEPGAVVCRVAPSFIRFGNFELPASRGDMDTLKKLLDYTLERDFPSINVKLSGKEAYLEMLKEICRTTAIMISHWMRVGYVHGVMNTDNMSVLGLTIDYGPYGWVDNYDREWTPNTTDGQRGRYKFGNQLGIGLWNLVRLANALFPVIDDVEPLKEALGMYEETLMAEMNDMSRCKLGLASWKGDDDENLFKELCEIMEAQETDMTILYRKLADVPIVAGIEEDAMLEKLSEAFYSPVTESNTAKWKSWLSKYAQRVKEDGKSDAERRELMNKTNPKYVLRNYIAQNAIDAAADGDFSLVNEVLEVMRKPYDEQPEYEGKYFCRRPDWARTKVGCSALSCSS